MKILVLNCGSSSIKYQLIEIQNVSTHNLLAKGQIERVGFEDAILSHRPTGLSRLEQTLPVKNHTEGISVILDALTNSQHGVIKSLEEISAAGHRVAHGGEFFADSAIINDDVKSKIISCFELAPLHNPANFMGIESIEKVLPNIPQVAVFDTSFHQTMPADSYIYAIDYKYYEQYRIRKYGFHGTSHKFVAQKACEMTGLDFHNSKIITCHIGNGGSITAIKNGKSMNTSMGFTPVDGLMMGTRCGSIDPGALLYIMDKENKTAKDINNLINKESGFLGVSGVSSDMRDVLAAEAQGNKRAELATDIFCKRIKGFVGQYFFELEGADMIVFTGGVGENEEIVRRRVTDGLSSIGIKIDQTINKATRGTAILSTADSKVKVLSIETNEELVIANDTYRLINKN